jgi:hypothetical protein
VGGVCNSPSPRSVLAFLIPDRRNGYESWGYSTLGKAQEKPYRCEASETLRCSKTHADNSPQNDCDSDKLREVKLRH